VNSVVTDQGSNFVRLLKQKLNKFIEDDNASIHQSKDVDTEINEIAEEITEINDSENLNLEDEADDSEIDEEKLKKEEGGIISYLDEPEYEANEQQGFQITLGIPLKVIQIY
jgi:hypothetical protein